MHAKPKPEAPDVEPIGSLVELHIQLLKLSSLINRPMREGVAEPSGLSTDEIKIVMCLGGEGAMAGHDIADVMAIAPMNVSRALSALDARGWIDRVRDAGDRRRKPVMLSTKGVAAYRAMTPMIAEVARYLLEGLGAGERATLGKLAAKIIARMEAWPRDHTKR